MPTHIDISLEFNSRQLDLRIPTAVTLAHLSGLIGQVLHEHNIVMPQRWHLEVRNKPITVGEFDIVGAFPVGDGDVLAVVSLPDPSLCESAISRNEVRAR